MTSQTRNSSSVFRTEDARKLEIISNNGNENATKNEEGLCHLKFDIWKWPKRKKIDDTNYKFKHGKRKFDVWKWPKRKKNRPAKRYESLDQDKLYTSRLNDIFVLKLGESDEKRVDGNDLKTKVVETSVDFDYLEIFLVLISGKEETETTLSPAMDVVIQVLKRINRFRVLDVDDGSNLCELVSTRDDMIQSHFYNYSLHLMRPRVVKDSNCYTALLSVVASEDTRLSDPSSHNER